MEKFSSDLLCLTLQQSIHDRDIIEHLLAQTSGASLTVIGGESAIFNCIPIALRYILNESAIGTILPCIQKLSPMKTLRHLQALWSTSVLDRELVKNVDTAIKQNMPYLLTYYLKGKSGSIHDLNALLDMLVKHEESSTLPVVQGTLQQFLPIVGLYHATTLESMYKILQTGFLTWRELTEREIEYSGFDEPSSPTFPGIYFTAVLQSKLGTSPYLLGSGIYQGEVAFIVDPYILNRSDFHINNNDLRGFIDESHTYSRPTINQILPRLELPLDDSNYFPIREIIFHNHIPPAFIKAIYVPHYQVAEVRTHLAKLGLTVFIPLITSATLYQTTSYYETDTKILDSPIYRGLFDSAEYTPAFCSFVPTIYPETTIKVARNCGFTADQIRDICKGTNGVRKIWSMIQDLPDVKQFYAMRHPPTYFPPYTGTSLQKSDEQILNILQSA